MMNVYPSRHSGDNHSDAEYVYIDRVERLTVFVIPKGRNVAPADSIDGVTILKGTCPACFDGSSNIQ